MNNLKTTDNGGLPFVLDDLRWMDQGVRNAFLGMFSAFNSDGLIISGCVKSTVTGTTSITEGYVILTGEVCYMPAHSYPEVIAGEVEIISIDVSYDVSGNKIFQDATNISTYEVRNAKVEKVPTPAPGGSIYFTIANTLMSDSFNLSDSKTIASSEAVNILRSTLYTLINQKQDSATAVKFYYGSTLPNPISYQLGDLYYVAVSVPYQIYAHDGANWDLLN